jgi:magnesium transporter
VPWVPPGTLVINPNSPKPVLEMIAFGPHDFIEQKLDSVQWVIDNRDRYKVIWLNVDGLGDINVLQQLGDLFNLHRLALEDVVNVHQRAKVDIYDDCYFIVMRMLQRHTEDHEIETEQLSMFLGQGFVLTFQEGIPGDCLDSVRERLRKESARIREHASDFLAYSIIDAVVDGYFPILEDLGERLEELENDILMHPSRELVRRIHDAKRDLLTIRRVVWPLREAIGPLSRDESGLVSNETKVFLRDCHDHCIQVVDLVETYRELGSSLMDVYLSSLSNKMNEVMKVLTIITTIFVPLTFVAGIYGMNFNTEKSPLNMPELDWYWGYPACLLLMLTIAFVELWFFWKRGWIFGKDGIGDLSYPTTDRSIDHAESARKGYPPHASP